MEKIWILNFLFIFISYFSYGQGQNAIQNVPSSATEWIAMADQSFQPYLPVIIEKGNTLYGLSRQYGVSMDKLREINGLNHITNIAIGQVIKVPLDQLNPSAEYYSMNIFHDGTVPVYYIVQPGNTLYTIAKKIFNQNVEDFLIRNGLKSHDLYPGQKLLAGYIHLPPIETKAEPLGDSVPPPVDVHTKIPNEPIMGLYTQEQMTKKEINHWAGNDQKLTYENFEPAKDYKPNLPKLKLSGRREIAIWDKQSIDNDNLFALHSIAPPGTVIEIYNPMLRRTSHAQVVGKIPANTYPEDVTLIISPRVARSLGALDARFMVEVKYYEPIDSDGVH
ncbi:MAG TPA: LysM peptidoglycan-binding domain-containing protein [Saprospiraceae bacterium]|nr:LysM peptidoglycan-binding domain-containing protein [Saprospiraceae bacterium]